jgi:hypothetical protein
MKFTTDWLHVSKARSASRCVAILLLILYCWLILACNRNLEPAPSDAGADKTPIAPAPARTAAAAVVSQKQLATEFSVSQKVLFMANNGTELAKMKSNPQVTLTPLDNGLKVTSSGDDPQLHLPPFAEAKQFILQVVIESPVDTSAQLFYMLQGQSSYPESQSYLVPLKPGKNVIYFRLDSPSLIDPLRFDPAAHPGDYVIQSITAKAVPNSRTP